MTKSANSVPISRALNIAFNKLVLSQSNVRQINSGVSIDDLAEDIARRGLLMSLNVRPIFDEKGAETGTFEVPAGGRRYRALAKLVKDKRMLKTAPIPCVIRGETSHTSMEDDSLAENTHRTALHPLDQYRAFLTLRRQNMSEEDIAARYFVSVATVKQRLRLAAVSPKLLDLYSKDEMSLDQLMAFSLTGDHPRQEEIWTSIEGLQDWQKGPRDIRNLLINSTVAATDRRVVFVGLNAYEAAGGEVLRDLFSADNGGWLQDAILLDRLVGEKLQALAKDLKDEGWKWIEVLPSLPFDHLVGLRKLDPIDPGPGEEDKVAFDALKAEYGRLNDAFVGGDELPASADRRLGEIETAMEALAGDGGTKFDPLEVACAGVVISLDRHGQAQIQRGYMRPEDEPNSEVFEMKDVELTGEGEGAPPVARETAIIPIGNAEPKEPLATSAEDEEGDVLRPLPEKLIMELTVFRTIALRDAVARNPRVAMTLLLHRLVSDTFQHRYGGACLSVSVFAPQIYNYTPKGLNESMPAVAMTRRHELWGDVIPHDDQALWEWLDDQTAEVRAELLAYCVSYGVNALMEKPNPYGAGPTQQGIDVRLKQAVRVAEATGLDLVAVGWRPTADSYLNRVPRPRILEAVREGCGERTAQMIDHLKKGDMVIEAERLLAETGWLPELLRGPEPENQTAVVVADEPSELPAFLTGADPETPAIAAE